MVLEQDQTKVRKLHRKQCHLKHHSQKQIASAEVMPEVCSIHKAYSIIKKSPA